MAPAARRAVVGVARWVDRHDASPTPASRIPMLPIPCSHIASRARPSSRRISCDAAMPAIPASPAAPTPSHHSRRPAASRARRRTRPWAETAITSSVAAVGRRTRGAWITLGWSSCRCIAMAVPPAPRSGARGSNVGGRIRGFQRRRLRPLLARTCEGPASRRETGPSYEPGAALSLADVGRLQALRPLHDLELHLLSFREAAEAVHLDRGVVAEDVLATVVLGDEAEALRVIEPLHDAGRH